MTTGTICKSAPASRFWQGRGRCCWLSVGTRWADRARHSWNETATFSTA